MRFVKPAILNSLSIKVLGAYLIGVILSILLIGLGLAALTTFRSEVLDQRVSWQAQKIGSQLIFDSAGTPVGLHPSDHGTDWIFQSFQEELAFRVLDASGRALIFSPAGEKFWVASNLATLPPEAGHSGFERNGRAFRVATEPVLHDGRAWFVQYASSVRLADLFQVEFALPFMGKGIALFSITLFVVFGACALLTIRRTFKPLRDLSASAAAISTRSLHSRLQSQGVPMEVAPLVESFNRALGRLEHGFRVQQEFLAAAAHELKTPLSLIRAQIEVDGSDGDRAALLQDVDHMTRHVQQLLLLAEASEIENYHPEPLDVIEVAYEVIAYLQRMAEKSNVALDLSWVELRPIWLADRGAFFTLLKNLLENAIQHSPSNSTVNVEVKYGVLSVRDWGAGAEEQELAQMFARFWRGAHRRDQGAGLGLSICQEIAQAHGWNLHAERAEPGLRFVLTWPEPGQEGPARGFA